MGFECHYGHSVTSFFFRATLKTVTRNLGVMSRDGLFKCIFMSPQENSLNTLMITTTTTITTEKTTTIINDFEPVNHEQCMSPRAFRNNFFSV